MGSDYAMNPPGRHEHDQAAHAAIELVRDVRQAGRHAHKQPGGMVRVTLKEKLWERLVKAVEDWEAAR